MKKIIYVLLIGSLAILFYSCEKEVLDKTPLDEISDPEFWNTENDLQLYLNSLYEPILLSWTGGGGGADPCEDLGTDIVIEDENWWGDRYTFQLDGTLTVPASGGGWDWSNVRRINYFIENADRATGTGVDHYIGEGYFLRAYIYFDLLRKFGDLPIITKVLNVGDDELFSARSPRTEVVDFILSDLDVAISKLGPANEAGPNRVHKDVARLFKARVALYEGTWEKYHTGTVFAGSTDGTAYMQEAVAQAQAVINTGTYSLSTGDPDQAYYELFVQMDLSSNPEVLLWRDYDNLGLGVANTIWNWPNAQGVTQWMIEYYLCTDGLPTAVSPLFVGQDSLSVVEINRDPRLENTIMVPGELDFVALSGDSVYFNVPNVGTNGTPTGYELEKWRTHWLQPETNSRTRDVPFIQFRFAEALLIYAEAKAELGTLTQADVDMSINLLRDRVGMPHLEIASITADPNWPDYGHTLPDYLYEIRRERVVELFGEGHRFDDLMRWRAHTLFVGKRPKGTMYTADIEAVIPGVETDENGFIDPYEDYLNGGVYGFNPERDYLRPLPINELTINKNLNQNPGW